MCACMWIVHAGKYRLQKVKVTTSDPLSHYSYAELTRELGTICKLVPYTQFHAPSTTCSFTVYTAQAVHNHMDGALWKGVY